jgi:NAD-reducing hydrogenase small subunit
MAENGDDGRPVQGTGDGYGAGGETKAERMKKKLATVWLGGCSGCHMSFLDLDERLLEIALWADVVKSPVVDQKGFPEADVVLVEGAIANADHEDEIEIIRRRAKVLVAFGDCAVTANVPSMRNYWPKAAVLQRSYVEVPGTVDGKVPTEEIAPLTDRVRPLHELVKVDYYLPGCPPSADLIYYVLVELLHDRVPVLDAARLKFG